MLKLVLLSLTAAAVLALPTFPDLHRQKPEEKDAVIQTTKVTQFLPGQEPKQFSEVRLLQDGESIPIERHQSKRQGLDVDLSRRQEPGEEGLQESNQESSVFRMPAKFEERLQESSHLKQSKRQTDAGEDTGEKRLQDPENDQLAFKKKEDDVFEPVARISILRTIIVFLNPVKSSEGVQSTDDETQAELTKQSEQLENLEQPLEQQPELYESPTVDVQKRQTEQEQARIPTSQSGLLLEKQQQQQQEQQPQLRIRKRRQIRHPSSFQPLSSNVEMPNNQRQLQPDQLGENLDEEQRQLPLERNTRNIFQPTSTIPKLPRQDRQELLKQKVDVQDRLKDQLPSRRLHIRSIVPHHVGSQDPSPLMKGAETNLEEKMMPQQDSEPDDKLQPYIEQLESLIGFMEKTKEHIQHEAHHLHSSNSRKRREEPFPSVLIPPRLIEQKENIDQTKENQPEMKENVPETRPERPAEPLPELPEEKAQPEQPIQEKKGKELEMPKEEKDFREILESTPEDVLEKGKEKAQDIKQPAEEKFDQGKESLEDLSENLRPDEEQHPVSDVMEKGKEKVSEVQKPIAEGEEDIQKNLPDVEEIKESMPDIQKGGRESHGKSLDVEQLKLDQESAALPKETPMAGEILEETPQPTETPETPEVLEQGTPQPDVEDVTRGKELTETEIQSQNEELTQDQDLRSGKKLRPEEKRPSENEQIIQDEDLRRGKNVPQPEISKPLEGERISPDERRGKEQSEIQKPMELDEDLRQNQELRSGKELENREEIENLPHQEDLRSGKELAQPEISDTQSAESNISEESDELPVNPNESSLDQSNTRNENIQNVQQPEELSPSDNQPQQSIEGKHLTPTEELMGSEDVTPIQEPQGYEVNVQRQPESSPLEIHSKHQQQKAMLNTGSSPGNQQHQRTKRTLGYYPYRRWPYYRRRYGYPLFLGAGIFPGFYGGGYYGGGMYGGGMYGGGALDVAADVGYGDYGGGYGDYGGGYGDYGGGFGDYGGGFGDYGGGFGDYGGGFDGIDY